MELKSQLITPVYAQTDGNSHPTIPFNPGGLPTITPTPAGYTGPIVLIESAKSSYGVGESGSVNVVIDSKGVEVDEFLIVIEYDPTHIDIYDNDPLATGVQVEYDDDHFLLVSTGNLVETGLSDSESGQTGKITIHARARDGEAVTITDRTVATINFVIKSSKTSRFYLSKENTALLLDSTNQIDVDELTPFTITSTGVIQPTISPTISPTITPTPKTALDNRLQSGIIIMTGVLLVAAGFHIRKSLNKANSK